MYTASCGRKEGLWRPRDLPQFENNGQQRAGYWHLAPHQATVGDVSSVGKGLRQFPDLRGRCAYCALKRPRDFSCPLLGAHQLLSHSRLAAVSRRAPSYAPCPALVKIPAAIVHPVTSDVHVADMAGIVDQGQLVHKRDFASRDRLRECDILKSI